MHVIIKDKFTLLTDQHDGRKVKLGLGLGILLSVAIAWLALNLLFPKDIKSNPPAIMYELEASNRPATDSELNEIFNYYRSIWQFDYEYIQANKDVIFQNNLVSDAPHKRQYFHARAIAVAPLMDKPLNEWLEYLKNEPAPASSQVFFALQEIYSRANHCESLLALETLKAWYFANSYRERQLSCGSAEQRSLFEFLSLFNFETRRQPELIFAAIAKIENPSVREKMLASYEAHLTTLSELFNRYDGAERLQAALESDRSPQLEINWYQYLQQK